MDTGGSYDSEFETRAKQAGAKMARDLATDTDKFPGPFQWRVAAQKSVFPFLVGMVSVGAAAGLDWLLQSEEWKGKVAPYAVPAIIASATYARNYLKQQARTNTNKE